METKKLIRLSDKSEVLMSFEEVKEKFQTLLKNRANKYSNVLEYEEAYQIGLIALWRVYEKFDINLKYVFITLAYQYIDGLLKDEIRSRTKIYNKKNHQLKSICSLNEVISMTPNGSKLTIADSLGEYDVNIDNVMYKELLNKLFEKLSNRKKKELILYFGEDLTAKEIGRLFGVTDYTIRQSIGSTVKLLRPLYNKIAK